MVNAGRHWALEYDSPLRLRANDKQRTESEALVQLTFLDGNGDHEPAEEEKVRVLQARTLTNTRSPSENTLTISKFYTNETLHQVIA